MNKVITRIGGTKAMAELRTARKLGSHADTVCNSILYGSTEDAEDDE